MLSSGHASTVEVGRMSSCVLLGGTVAASTTFALVGIGGPADIGVEIRDAFGVMLDSFISIKAWLLIAAILAAEHWFPAVDNQRIMSPSYVIDMVYVFLQAPFMVALVMVTTTPLRGFLDGHASWLVLDVGRDLHPLVAVTLALLLADFIAWGTHVMLHKVGWLWRFHMIHHAQAELNLFTANRAHPVDVLFQVAVRFLPLYFLMPSVTEQGETMLLYTLAITWHIRFQHANIRWTLGPLRYIFVTPQSHRIHHSLDPAHWNSNYANVFTFWDRMFGTHNGDTTVHPRVGIADGGALRPRSYRPDDLARAYCRQLAFPFTDAAVEAGRADRSLDAVDESPH